MGANTGRGPRLYHTKSRTGCARCRARRVKCNESRPICSNCERHGVGCEYDRPPNYNPYANGQRGSSAVRDKHGKFRKADAAANGSSSSVPSSQSPPQLDVHPLLQPACIHPTLLHTESFGSISSSHTFNNPYEQPDLSTVYWEMRAFHFFATETALTLSGSHHPEVLRSWAFDIPRLAMEQEALRNQVIATACLHMMLTDFEMKNQKVPAGLVACRERYCQAALQSHLRTISSPWGTTDAEADSMCFTASLLLVDAMAGMRDRALFDPSAELVPPPTDVSGMANLPGMPGLSVVPLPFVSSQSPSAWSPASAYSPSHVLGTMQAAHPNSNNASPLLQPEHPTFRPAPSFGTTTNFHGVSVSPAYLPPEQWLRMTRGTLTVFRAVSDHYRSRLMRGIVGTVVKYSRNFADREVYVSDANTDVFRYLLGDMHLRPISSGEELDANDYHDALRLTVSYIGALQNDVEAGIATCELVRRVAAFACIVPPAFFDRLVDRDPQALLVMAHFFAIATHVQSVWFIGHMPRRECEAIDRALHLPEHMQYMMAQPRATLALTRDIPVGVMEPDAATTASPASPFRW